MTELQRLEITAKYYQRQLDDCDKALTEAGVPEWVMNSWNDGVPANCVPERLRWFLARRKNITKAESEQRLQNEMRLLLQHACEYAGRDSAPERKEP